MYGMPIIRLMDPVLFLAFVATLLSLLHMIAPDHWMPLSALALKNSIDRKRVNLIAFILGLLHGITSTALALLVVFFGIYAFGTAEIRVVSVTIILVVAAFILINSFREAHRKSGIESSSLAVSVFPDPAFLPILVAAAAYGNLILSTISILFVFSSATFLLVVVILVNMGLMKALQKVSPVAVDRIIVMTLLLTGLYIYIYG